MAGLFALLNDYRLSEGLPLLGFINPLIYSTKGISAFNDIISGSNPGCGTNGKPNMLYDYPQNNPPIIELTNYTREVDRISEVETFSEEGLLHKCHCFSKFEYRQQAP